MHRANLAFTNRQSARLQTSDLRLLTLTLILGSDESEDQGLYMK